LKRGDTVALFMENRPDFVITWLGLAKVGVRIALVNSTIKKAPLVHSIQIVEAKMVLFGVELTESIATVAKQLKEELKVELVCCGGEAKGVCERVMEVELAKQPTERVSREHRHGVRFGDVFGMIYTSGTTGYPKAGECVVDNDVCDLR
jgi:fatty-acyl-CoA synthase